MKPMASEIHPLESELWQGMMSTFGAILTDTKDKEGWAWLKEKFASSLIWFLPHPNNESNEDEKEDEMDEMESSLKRTLFWELLKRVRLESKKQSDSLLKDEINAIKSEHADDWQQLLKYRVVSEHSKNARQDALGCIVPKYSENELNEERYPPSTHFSAKEHYDSNIYLNELRFRANILDSMFQSDMERITNQITTEINENVTFQMGPVKTLTRSQAKVENDYISEAWPTSAKILDVNRCALQFVTVGSLLKFLKAFEEKVKNGNAGSIKSIIRCKNGWSVYNEELPSYTDIKLNILIESEDGKAIIAEIQFLLEVMSGFKKVAHKLYGIERKFELVFNYKQMADKMEKFEDVKEEPYETAMRLIQDGDVIGFDAFESCLPYSFDELCAQNFENFSTVW